MTVLQTVTATCLVTTLGTQTLRHTVRVSAATATTATLALAATTSAAATTAGHFFHARLPMSFITGHVTHFLRGDDLADLADAATCLLVRDHDGVGAIFSPIDGNLHGVLFLHGAIDRHADLVLALDHVVDRAVGRIGHGAQSAVRAP